MVKSNLKALAHKYSDLINYVSSVDSFEWIYRVEGDETLKSGNVANSHLQGTWYTESWSDIQQIHKPKIKSLMDGKEPIVYALLVPKQMLDSRELILKHNYEINIINPSLRFGRITLEDSINLDKNNFPLATKEIYVRQFDFVQEYFDLINNN